MNGRFLRIAPLLLLGLSGACSKNDKKSTPATAPTPAPAQPAPAPAPAPAAAKPTTASVLSGQLALSLTDDIKLPAPAVKAITDAAAAAVGAKKLMLADPTAPAVAQDSSTYVAAAMAALNDPSLKLDAKTKQDAMGAIAGACSKAMPDIAKNVDPTITGAALTNVLTEMAQSEAGALKSTGLTGADLAAGSKVMSHLNIASMDEAGVAAADVDAAAKALLHAEMAGLKGEGLATADIKGIAPGLLGGAIDGSNEMGSKGAESAEIKTLVNTGVGGLADAGVAKADVGAIATADTKAAVAEMKDAGVTSGADVGAALKDITSASLAGLKDDGFASADIADEVDNITGAEVSGLKDPNSDATPDEYAALMKDIVDGAEDTINSSAIADADAGAAIKNLDAGMIASFGDLGLAGSDITSLSKDIVDVSIADLASEGGITDGVTLEGLAKAAADGATTADNVLRDDGTLTEAQMIALANDNAAADVQGLDALEKAGDLTVAEEQTATKDVSQGITDGLATDGVSQTQIDADLATLTADMSAQLTTDGALDAATIKATAEEDNQAATDEVVAAEKAATADHAKTDCEAAGGTFDTTTNNCALANGSTELTAEDMCNAAGGVFDAGTQATDTASTPPTSLALADAAPAVPASCSVIATTTKTPAQVCTDLKGVFAGADMSCNTSSDPNAPAKLAALDACEQDKGQYDDVKDQCTVAGASTPKAFSDLCTAEGSGATFDDTKNLCTVPAKASLFIRLYQRHHAT